MQTLLVASALVLMNLAVFWPVRRFDFVLWDDPAYINENAHVMAGLSWRGVAWAFTSSGGFYWHPLTWLSHMLDVELYGLNAGGHHVTSLLLHTATTVLLFLLLHHTTGSLGRSAVVAALFGVHPLHVESVAWVAERKDVLSALFWVLATWMYCSYTQTRRTSRYLGMLAAFALGLLSKPMIVTLPLTFFLLDLWPLDRFRLIGAGETPSRARNTSGQARHVVLEKVPLLTLALASAVLTTVNQWQAGAVRPLADEGFPLGLRISNALVTYGTYIGRTVWPSHLAAFYPYPHAIPSFLVAASGLGLAAVSFLAFRVRRTRPYVTVGWFWYLITLTPVIGLVQVGDQASADRFTYIPSIGLFIAGVWGSADLSRAIPHRRMLLACGAGAMVLSCAVVARAQVMTWKDTMALWVHAASVTTDNERAQANIGNELLRHGHTAEAIPHIQEAARITATYHWKDGRSPGAASLREEAGVLLSGERRYTEAATQFAEALRLQPDRLSARRMLALAQTNWGVELQRGGDTAGAVSRYQQALENDPDCATAHHNLGTLLANAGRLDDAIQEIAAALRIEPSQAKWHYDLALLLDAKRDTAAALRHLERALALDPQNVNARELAHRLSAHTDRRNP